MKVPLKDLKETQPKRKHGDIAGLKASIQENGLICPLAISENNTLLAGRRRYQALLELYGLEYEVECHVIPVNGDPLRAFGIALDENLKRKNLSDTEEAVTLKQFEDLAVSIRGKGKSGQRTDLTSSIFDEVGWTHQDTAELIGYSRPAVVRAIQIATAIEEHPELAGLKSGEAILRAVKIEKQREALNTLPSPSGLFDVIVIDPPWEMDAAEYNSQGLRAVPPYPTMTIEQMARLDLPASPDCVLWLWVINNRLHDGLHLLNAWGFEYKNTLTWAKDTFGLGRWLRGQTEHCLLATKGRPYFSAPNSSTLLIASRREHSRKPEEFYKLVDQVCAGRKLDYFSRQRREGWDVFGDEIR